MLGLCGEKLEDIVAQGAEEGGRGCSVMSPMVSGVVGWGCYWCEAGVMIAMKSDVCDGSAWQTDQSLFETLKLKFANTIERCIRIESYCITVVALYCRYLFFFSQRMPNLLNSGFFLWFELVFKPTGML